MWHPILTHALAEISHFKRKRRERVWRRIISLDTNDVGLALSCEIEFRRPRGRQPRVRDQQLGVGPNDFRGVRRLALHAAQDVGGNTIAKLETAAQCQIDAGLFVEMGVGRNALRLGANEESGEIHTIAADVHECAATRVAPIAWILPVAPAGGPVTADVQYPADTTGGDDAFGFGNLRMKAIHEPFHQPALAGVSGGEHLLDLRAGTGQRLLAQNMFACFQGAYGPFAVQAVVQRVDDDVDFGIVNQGLVTRMRARDAMLDAGSSGSIGVAAGDGHERRFVNQVKRLSELAEDQTCPQNAVAEFPTRRHVARLTTSGLRCKFWLKAIGHVDGVFDLGGFSGGCYSATAMTQWLKWLYLLTLAVWIGSIVFFSFAVAPTVFKTLKPEDAAALIRRIFSKYYLIGIVCSAIGIVCVGLLLADRSFGKWPAILTLL